METEREFGAQARNLNRHYCCRRRRRRRRNLMVWIEGTGGVVGWLKEK